jgi:hypothetical protein
MPFRAVLLRWKYERERGLSTLLGIEHSGNIDAPASESRRLITPNLSFAIVVIPNEELRKISPFGGNDDVRS